MPGWPSGLVLHLNNRKINCQLLNLSCLRAYDISDVSQGPGESELRTSNLLDLLGCVVHELSPSALVFFHAGHGFGVFGGLRNFGFDGVHCEDRLKYRTKYMYGV
jgi:hypothetical protein